MDVLLARDVDLLRLVLEELDVVVDVENVLVEGGEVVQLREGGSRGSASERAGGRAGSAGGRSRGLAGLCSPPS